MIDKVVYSRILIVDDDESYLASMRRMLRGQYEITTTKDPVQALKIIEHHGPFAVVISDFRMPLLNGIELLSRIMSIDKNIQRIMITGYAELQMAIDAINHGKITAFLTKPTPAVSIRSVVADAIQTYRQNVASQPIKPVGHVLQTTKQNTVSLYAPLTVKEGEVLSLLAKGFSNVEIAQELNVTVGTIKTHLNNLFCKMNVNSRTKVVAKALELGLIKTVL